MSLLGIREKQTLLWLMIFTFTISFTKSSSIDLISCGNDSLTQIFGKMSRCKQIVLNEQFLQSRVDASKWLVDHRIPFNDISEEFNSYENTRQTIFVENGTLYLKPVLRDHVRGALNLRSGCTSSDDSQCYYQQRGSYLLPPVRSARIISKIPFKYGVVEIKAKLPAGDWIVPIIELSSSDHVKDIFQPKIVIAYTRGNSKQETAYYTYINEFEINDFASSQLSAGPIFQPYEPERSSKYVKIVNYSVPFSDDFHVFTLHWLPDKLTFYMDDDLIGTVETTYENQFKKELRLTLGVLVGGLVDFPDDPQADNDNRKPWRNTDPLYVKKFYDAKDQWYRTWHGNDVALQIDYVKIYAV